MTAATCGSNIAGRTGSRSIRGYAEELVALRPVSSSLHGVRPSALATGDHTIPIVFPTVSDPVGAGFVASLARPGGNVTGFTQYRIWWLRSGWSYCSEFVPKAHGSAVFGNPRYRLLRPQLRQYKRRRRSDAVSRSMSATSRDQASDAAFAPTGNGGLFVLGDTHRSFIAT